MGLPMNRHPATGVEIVFTTTDTMELAKKIAEKAVSMKLSACVQISGPLTSTYCWKGKVQSEQEYRMDFKIESANRADLYKLIKELHTYDLPEIMTIPVVDGSIEYLAWVKN